MERRSVLLLGGAIFAPTLRAQPAPRIARVGILTGLAPGTPFFEPLRKRLEELGHVEGRNLGFDYGYAAGQLERLPALAAELLARKVDVLVTSGPAAAYAANATQSVPIVALAVNNPVRMGLAETMARPGRNVTGVSSWGIELLAKRLQVLTELQPGVRRVGVLNNPHAGPLVPADVAEFERALDLTIRILPVGAVADLDAAFATLERERIDGILVAGDPFFFLNRARIGEWCARVRLPSIWGDRSYLDAGGLASYQSDLAQIMRRGGDLVDKILKGAKAGDIPFEQATKLELVINLKAARALGITVPAGLLATADAVLE